MTDKTPTGKRKLRRHVLLNTDHRRNPKVRKLSDREYRAWIEMLSAAMDQTPIGHWPSREYLDASMGEYADVVPVLMRLDLLRQYGHDYFPANFDIYQEGIVSDTHRALQEAWRVRDEARRVQNATRPRRGSTETVTRNHEPVPNLHPKSRAGDEPPTLRDAPLRNAAQPYAAQRYAPLRSADSSEEMDGGQSAPLDAAPPSLSVESADEGRRRLQAVADPASVLPPSDESDSGHEPAAARQGLVQVDDESYPRCVNCRVRHDPDEFMQGSCREVYEAEVASRLQGDDTDLDSLPL